MRRLLIKILVWLLPKQKYAKQLNFAVIPEGAEIDSFGVDFFQSFISFNVHFKGNQDNFWTYLDWKDYETLLSDLFILQEMIEKKEQ